MPNSLDLIAALGAQDGVVCLVGAGGKKTTMYALAAAHPGRVLLSSTSHMYAYKQQCVDQLVELSADDESPPKMLEGRVIAVAGATDTANRVGGIPPERIHEIFVSNQFDLCILKADGARARWIKSPGSHEPIIPPFADTVIPVVSARVIGRSLDERIAHRPERLTQLIGIAQGDSITPAHIAALLSHSQGSLKGVGDARVIPLINMVDDDENHRLARDAALAALASTDRIDRIVLASMKHAEVVDVIERTGPRTH